MSRVVNPTTVVLDSDTWKSELAIELGRLGVADPATKATKALQHIVARQGWYRLWAPVTDSDPTITITRRGA